MPPIRKIIESLSRFDGPNDPSDTRLTGLLSTRGILSTKSPEEFLPVTSVVTFDPNRPKSVEITTTIAEALPTQHALALAHVLNHRIQDKFITFPSEKNETLSDLVAVVNRPTAHIEKKGLPAIQKEGARYGIIRGLLSAATGESSGVRPDRDWQDEIKEAETLVESVFAHILKGEGVKQGKS